MDSLPNFYFFYGFPVNFLNVSRLTVSIYIGSPFPSPWATGSGFYLICWVITLLTSRMAGLGFSKTNLFVVVFL